MTVGRRNSVEADVFFVGPSFECEWFALMNGCCLERQPFRFHGDQLSVLATLLITPDTQLITN